MKHDEGHLKTNNKDNIYYQFWLPEKEIKAVLLIVHGLAEHSGRYENIINWFVPLGYAVYALDHIGHGKSSGQRGYVDNFSDYTYTLKIYLDKVQNWQKNKPIFLFGHSMGGLISASFLLSYKTQLAGAIFSSPSIKSPKKVSSILVMIGTLLSKLLPTIGLIKLTSEGVSSDKTVVDNYLVDPLVYTGKTTARLASELYKAMQIVFLEASNISLPIIIFQGGQDQLVHPDGAQILFDMVSSADKTLKIYEQMQHEVFNEPGNERVLDDMQDWLDKRNDYNLG
jgi:alpha-beta hydrolase superfamily lysophospholipase